MDSRALPEPLPMPWVERLFAKFLVRYGAAWSRLWEGIPMEAVKADWAEELAGFQRRPEAIAYGLEYLPHDKPPTVQQFRALCNRKSEPAPKAIRGPLASPDVVAKVRSGLTPADNDPKAWARRLRARELACERLTPAQRAMWREALGAEA